MIVAWRKEPSHPILEIKHLMADYKYKWKWERFVWTPCRHEENGGLSGIYESTNCFGHVTGLHLHMLRLKTTLTAEYPVFHFPSRQSVNHSQFHIILIFFIMFYICFIFMRVFKWKEFVLEPQTQNIYSIGVYDYSVICSLVTSWCCWKWWWIDKACN